MKPDFRAPERSPTEEVIVKEACKFYISPEEPECGKPAVGTVRVRNRAITATVPLCVKHKAIHDETFARTRVGA